MSEAQAKALYAAAASILGALGAFGIVGAALQDQILGIVTSAVALASAVIPVIAHKRVGVRGVDSLGGLTAADIPAAPDGEPAGLTMADIPPADDEGSEPRHAEPSVIPDGEGVATN